MKKYFIVTAIVFSAGTLLISCGNNNNGGEEHKEAETTEQHANENTTALTEEQMKSIGVEIGSIENKQLTASLKANGLLQVPNQNKASINSVYNGVIKSLLIQPGNTVSKGQVIATIANPDFIQVQEEYLGLGPRIVLAEQEYNRQKELNEGNAGALKNLQSAEATLKSLQTRKSSLQSQLQLMGISPASLSNERLISVLSVRSPLSGVVSNVLVKIGSFVDGSTTVAEIVDNSQLHLDLYVYEKDLPKLKENQTIHFTLTNNPGKEYDAEIFSLGSSFEGESKAVTVHARVKGNKEGLIDGMNITAVISLEQNTVPALPSDAIVTWQGQDYIFVVLDPVSDTTHHDESEPHEHKNEAMSGDLSFERIPVAKGTSDVGYTEITLLKKIRPGSRVVTKGSFFILAKMTNSGGHEH